MDTLNAQQQLAVETTEGPLLILAGAGSGKTKVLTHRIAHLLNKGIPAHKILAITFTNKAATEMRTRVNKLAGEAADNVYIYTFHAFCAKFLRSEIDNLSGYKKNFTIYDTSDSKGLIKSIINDLNLDSEKFQPSVIQSKISEAKNKLIWPEQYKSIELGNPYAETIANIYAEYNNRMHKNSAVDFDDLILLTLKIFEQKEWLKEKFQEEFSYIMVDEYQDVNKVQYMLLKLLAAKHHNLCVVGDADQSIYSWRGADINNILSFEKDYPEAKVIKLEQNYRSTTEILEAANSVICHNQLRKDKKLWSDTSGNKLITYTCENEFHEARYIVSMIKTLTNRHGFKPSDIAILYRANSQSRPLEQELIRCNLPYQLIGSTKLNDRKEIKDILAYCSVLINPYDNHHLARIINVPKRGIGNTTISKMQSYAELHDLTLFDVISGISEIKDIKLSAKQKEALESLVVAIFEMQAKMYELPVKDTLLELLEKTNYLHELEKDNKPENKERIQHIQEFINIAAEYDNSNHTAESSLQAFLEETALISASDNIDSENRITLMTIHSAKGLEFPVVFLSGMEEGTFPNEQASNNINELEEERRLCYVGITRAKQLLCLTSANQRTIYGKARFLTPSRFISEIPPELIYNMNLAKTA